MNDVSDSPAPEAVPAAATEPPKPPAPEPEGTNWLAELRRDYQMVDVDPAKLAAFVPPKLPDLTANIAAGTVSAVLARKVVTDAVIRVLGNPSGVTMQTLGPESVQFAGVRTLGTVEFTASELASLAPAGDGVSAAGVAVGSATFGFPWVSLDPNVV